MLLVVLSHIHVLYKVVLTFESVDVILQCGMIQMTLSYGVVCFCISYKTEFGT